MKSHFLNGAPAGATGVANKTGYMNGDLFAQSYLPFIAKQTRCSKENKVLLILDNHSSHISLESIEFCRSVGIVVLTLPPHTSHRMQPLDRTVYGPLKAYYNASLDSWQRNHPGREVTIYDVASLSSNPFTLAMSKSNITSGFKSTGISPFNPDVFTEQDFVMAEVTDQPLLPETSQIVPPHRKPASSPTSAAPPPKSTGLSTSDSAGQVY